MGKYFGTDGVRGRANEELTAELALSIGRAAAVVLAENRTDGKRPRVVIGRDTRCSGEMLENAIAAGLLSAGADVYRLGVIPTPGVARLTAQYEMDAGVMVSASHNPFEDNGIKLFNRSGYKLSDGVEEEMEAIMDGRKTAEGIIAAPKDMGQCFDWSRRAADDYANYLRSCASFRLPGCKIAFDCANGSASATAAKVFRDCGAECVFLNDRPNGFNINAGCGSTHIQFLADYVKAEHCDLGVAFDGDADRCIMVDREGNVVDGDKLIAICAQYMKQHGLLKDNAVVVTVMSNLGFFKFAQEEELRTDVTAVGDRYILERMLEKGYTLGGEASGHIIFSQYMNTGDGQLSALRVLEIMAETGRSLGAMASVMDTYPQAMENLKVTKEERARYDGNEQVEAYIREQQELLGNGGRILVRPSGTEPLIRVMAEGKDQGEIQSLVERMAARIGELLR
ncbi:MAG: phosphoglucosamine mutase [Oscillospiraceae bacterium]|nr:phosphoglucosamine mutase [Oscillospiraceae bacterium]